MSRFRLWKQKEPQKIIKNPEVIKLSLPEINDLNHTVAGKLSEGEVGFIFQYKRENHSQTSGITEGAYLLTVNKEAINKVNNPIFNEFFNDADDFYQCEIKGFVPSNFDSKSAIASLTARLKTFIIGRYHESASQRPKLLAEIDSAQIQSINIKTGVFQP